MSVSIGHPAPTFTLFSTEKKEVALESYRGKNVVLLFFPMAFTGVCTEELCNIRDTMNQYNQLNSEVLAISVDSVFTLEKFKEEEGYNFPVLSDFNKEVSRAYDAIHEEFAFGMRGVSKRAAFVLDTEGIVRHAEILDVPTNMPDFEAVQACLKTLN